MPRQQAVYGKRSRAAVNPTDIFGSPQNLKEKKNIETFMVVEVVGENEKAAEMITTMEKVPVSSRKALGERNGNAVLKPEIPGAGKQKKKRSARGKKDVQEKPRVQGQTNLEDEQKLDDLKPDDVALELAEPGLNQPAAVDQNVEEAASTGLSPTPRTVKELPYDRASEEMGLEMQEPTPEQIHQAEEAAHAASTAQLCHSLPPIDPYTTHASSLLNLTAHEICSFSDWASQLAEHFLLSKIAEASFGEVYRLSLQPSLASDSATEVLRTEESVLKIIALTPPESTLPKSKRDRERAFKKAEAMSKPADVASEVKLLQRLSSIPGFTNFRDVRVLRGRPGGDFPAAWKDFNLAQKAAKKDLSIFPDPARKNSYSDDQLWAVIEMQDAGTDLERLVEKQQCSTIWQVWDVFWQVVLALAKGEEAAEFEHRDLHMGNICVRNASARSSQPLDLTKKLGFTNLEATLIDYTISRACMTSCSATSSSSSPGEQEIAFIDLAADEYLFNGDSTVEYQYDIYRYMRSAVHFSSPLTPFPADPSSNPITSPPNSEISWEQFHPLTNLVWMHYVLYMLLEAVDWPSSQKAPARKKKREREEWKRAGELEKILLEVQEILDPGVVGDNGVGKAGDLVAVALAEGWLDEEDIVGEVAGVLKEEEEEGDEELARKLEELVIEQAEAGSLETGHQQEVVNAEIGMKAAKTRRKR